MKPPPQELCLSEVELERLINGTHSETLGKIIAFTRGPACQPAQYLRIISVLYEKVDVNEIPYCIVGTDGVTNIVEALDFAFTALIGLGTTIRLWLNKLHQHFWKQLTKGLCAHWPDIRQWVLLLYQTIIVQEIIDIVAARLRQVPDFLGKPMNTIT